MIFIFIFGLYGAVFSLGWVGGVGGGVQRGTVNNIWSLKHTPSRHLWARQLGEEAADQYAPFALVEEECHQWQCELETKESIPRWSCEVDVVQGQHGQSWNQVVWPQCFLS